MSQTEEVALKEEGLMLRAQVDELEVVDAESFQLVGAIYADAKAKMKRITEFFKPMKQAQDAAKQVVLDRERECLAPWKATVEHTGPMIEAFDAKQKREKYLAEQRAAEEARIAVELAKRDGTPSVPIIIIPAVEVPIVTLPGQSFPVRAKAEVYDLEELVLAVARGIVAKRYHEKRLPTTVIPDGPSAPLEALTFEQGYLDDCARPHREKLKVGETVDLFPGVRAVGQRHTSTRA
jgi:hypothetical protein